MGASAGGARGGYQKRNARRRSSRGVMSDINVTPLVDVMLVLLIVFMVAAPLMTVGVPVELPKTEAKQMNTSTEPITITVQKVDGAADCGPTDTRLYLQETEIQADELVSKLIAIAKNGYEEQLFVRADASIPYGKVLEVMGALNGAGYYKIGLISDGPDILAKTEAKAN